MTTETPKKDTQLTKKTRRSLAKDEQGGTDFVESLILIALMALAVIVAVTEFGKKVQDEFKEEGTGVGNIYSGGGGS